MEKHPLYFFIDLIEGQKIADLRNSFLFVNPDLYVVEINERDEYIEHVADDIHNRGRVLERKYFIHFLNKKIPEKKAEAIGEIDLHVLNNLEVKQQSIFINNVCKTIDELVLTITQYPDAKKYPVIERSLLEIKRSLVRKYGSSKSQNITSGDRKNDDKLQWMGKSKVLITLFYDLYSNVENGGEPLIKATKDQIKNFLLNNFIEKDGQPLSASSIDTLLTPSKDDKRALKDDRIDTSKLKEKK